MASRVMLSISSSTSWPWSRNHSAIRVATKAARSRTSGGSSEVATTTTACAQALRAEVVLEELAHLAATLADQGDDADVGGGAAGDHRQQARLADAGAGEDAQALAAAARDQRVEGAHAERQRARRPGARLSASGGAAVDRDAGQRRRAAAGRPAAGRGRRAPGRAAASPTGTCSGRAGGDGRVAGADAGERAERQAGAGGRPVRRRPPRPAPAPAVADARRRSPTRPAEPRHVTDRPTHLVDLAARRAGGRRSASRVDGRCRMRSTTVRQCADRLAQHVLAQPARARGQMRASMPRGRRTGARARRRARASGRRRRRDRSARPARSAPSASVSGVVRRG